jgi:hypothetical protein
MGDQLDRIISHSESLVNKKNEYLEETYAKTNWTKIEQLEKEPHLNRILLESLPEAMVNNAYMDLVKGVELNKLTDPFRMQENKETKSNTARSLAKTIERYARQHTIIQSYCT